MKIFILLAIVLSVINWTLTQDSSQGSERIESEFLDLVSSIETRAVSRGKEVLSKVQSPFSKFNVEYKALRDRIAARLNALGVDGQAFSSKIDAEISSLSNDLKNEISDAELQPRIEQFLISLRSKYVDPVKEDIESLKSAVDANPNAIECWDKYKDQIQKLVNKTSQQMQASTNQVLNRLNVSIASWSRQVLNAILRLEKDVERKCGGDIACLNDYVSFETNLMDSCFKLLFPLQYKNNYYKISSRARYHVNRAKGNVNSALASINRRADQLFYPLSAQYQNIKSKVTKCVSNA